MKQSRAKDLLESAVHGSIRRAFRGKHGATESETVYPDGLTEAETKYVRSVWSKMSHGSSFSDALYAVARGDADAPSIQTFHVTGKEVREGVGQNKAGDHFRFDPSNFSSLEIGDQITASCELLSDGIFEAKRPFYGTPINK